MASFCPDFLRALGFSSAAVPEQNPSQWAEWMSNQKPWGNFDIHLNYFLFVLILVKRKRKKHICNVMWSESIQSNSTALLALFSAAAHMMDSDFIMFTCSCIFISFLYFFKQMNTGTGTEPQKPIDRTSVWLNMRPTYWTVFVLLGEKLISGKHSETERTAWCHAS